MLLPHLKSTPDRLFDTYTFDQKAKIVKGFLFDKKGHCQLDTEVLGLDGQKTRGWKSGNVLRHLGLTREFKNIFEGRCLRCSTIPNDMKMTAFMKKILTKVITGYCPVL